MDHEMWSYCVESLSIFTQWASNNIGKSSDDMLEFAEVHIDLARSALESVIENEMSRTSVHIIVHLSWHTMWHDKDVPSVSMNMYSQRVSSSLVLSAIPTKSGVPEIHDQLTCLSA